MEKIVVENVASPGRVHQVDAVKYRAMRDALLAVLPSGPPGETIATLQAAALPHLPQQVFPDGAKAGWWFKCVQLDLEAKGQVRRAGSPIRLFRALRPAPDPEA